MNKEQLETNLAALKLLVSEHNEKTTDYSIGLFDYNTETRELKSPKSTKKLSPKESELLKMLCENMNSVVSRDLALTKIWNDNNYFTTRSMDVFVAKLRKYLKKDANIEIINVHGNGFRLLVK